MEKNLSQEIEQYLYFIDDLFALLYLRFLLWWLDLKLKSGPDALKKGHVAEFHNTYIISFQ